MVDDRTVLPTLPRSRTEPPVGQRETTIHLPTHQPTVPDTLRDPANITSMRFQSHGTPPANRSLTALDELRPTKLPILAAKNFTATANQSFPLSCRFNSVSNAASRSAIAARYPAGSTQTFSPPCFIRAYFSSNPK